MAGVSVLVVLGILVAVNYLVERQNKRWDLTAQQAVLACPIRRSSCCKELDAPVQGPGVRHRRPTSSATTTRLEGVRVPVDKKVSTDYIDPDKKPTRRKQNDVQQLRHDRLQVQGPHRAGRRPTPSRTSPTASSRCVNPQQKKVYFTQGHGEKDPALERPHGYSGIADALKRRELQFDKLVLGADQHGSGRRHGRRRRRTADRLLRHRSRRDRRSYLDKGGKLLRDARPAGRARRSRPPLPQPHRRSLQEWGINVDATTVVVDASGMGRDRHRRVGAGGGATYPSHPITERFGLLTAFPLARAAMTPVTGGVSGAPRRRSSQTSPRSWAETDITSAADQRTRWRSTNRQGRQARPGVDRRRPCRRRASRPTRAGAKPSKAANEPKKPETRVVVIGDSDFASNGDLGVQGNRDLFMNIGQLAVAAGEPDRDPAARRRPIAGSR